MRHHLTVKGPLDIDEVRKWLAHPLARLRRKLARLPEDAVHLRALVRETESRPRAEVALTLRIPFNTLAVSEEALDARTALNEAFRELERLLEREKARLRRADTWRESTESFQRELLDRVGRDSARALSEADSDRLRAHLQEVERFVRRELRWLEASGDLVPGEIDPRDVVDAALVGAFERGERPPSRPHLLQRAAAALRSELARARTAREEVHIEDDVPEVPPEDAVSTLGSEIFDYYQPDEDLHVGDLLSGVSATPEEMEATAELTAVVRDALGAVPARWGQAFRLAEFDGLDESAIADALGIEKDAVSDLLAHTRAFLRERLDEAGLPLPGRPRQASGRGP